MTCSTFVRSLSSQNSKTSVSTLLCVSFSPSTLLSSSGPKPDTVARTGTPLPMPPRATNSVTDASGVQS